MIADPSIHRLAIKSFTRCCGQFTENQT